MFLTIKLPHIDQKLFPGIFLLMTYKLIVFKLPYNFSFVDIEKIFVILIFLKKHLIYLLCTTMMP